jgi:hypothetical protein
LKKEITDKNGYEVVCEYYGGPLCDGVHYLAGML